MSSSYPPVFRQTTQLISSPPATEPEPLKHHHHRPVNVDTLDVILIPIIDMQRFDPAVLDSACRDWGVFRVINHGIQTDKLMVCASRLFYLPFETKRELCSSKEGGLGKLLAYFWGTPVLSPAGEVVPQGPRQVDWVEGFNGVVGELRKQHGMNCAMNLAGGEDDPVLIISEFSNLLREYGDHVTSLAKTLFKSMASNLKISDHHLTNHYLDESTGMLRVYRYPPSPNIDDNQAKGLKPHTDSSVISILNQDEVGGLEFLKPDHDDDDNNWVQVKPVPGSLVVNLGDMMQAMSGDEYKSVWHRVRLDSNRERVSVCYFVFPYEDACVTTVDNSGLGKMKYKDFTYKEFREQVHRDVAATGKKIGLQHYRIE